MKLTLVLTSFAFATTVMSAPAPTKEARVVMATMVVVGTKIPSGWLRVSWECKGPLPIDRVKRAWISYVQPDGPAAKAGVKLGDALVAIGATPVESMTGVTLQWCLEREREPGTVEEFWMQTPGADKRIVTLKFERSAPRSP